MTLEIATYRGPPPVRFDSQSIDAGDATPKWNKLFPIDVVRYRRDFPGGKLAINRAFLSAFVRNWERQGKAALPVDYWHDDGSDGNSKAIASGWIESLELRADGLYGFIKWTAAAHARIAADELRFLSPSFALDTQDPTTGKSQGPTLLGAALLNTPFLFDLPRVAAGREPSTTPNPPEEPTMLRALMLSLFALPEVTTDDEISTKVRALKAENAKLAAELADKVELTSKPLKVELAASREQVTKLESDIVKLKTDAFNVEVDGFLKQLEADKKLLPANRESVKEICTKMGMEFARKHFASAPALVPTGTIGIGGGGDAKSAGEVSAQVDAELDRIKAANPSLSYREARKRLQAEKPELMKLASDLSRTSKTQPEA